MSSSLPAILMRYVAEELSRAPALIDRVFFVSLNHLRQPKDRLAPAHELKAHAELANGLAQHRDRCALAFVEALRMLVQQDLALQHEGYVPTEQSSEPSRLTLLDDNELAADVEPTRVLEQIKDVCEWELRELQTYTSTIAGLDHVAPESNPFRAELMARALRQAADALPMSRAYQVIFMHVCGEALAGALKLQYAAATTRLETLGVEPSRYRTGVPPAFTSSLSRNEATSSGGSGIRRAPLAGTGSSALDLSLDTVPMGLGDRAAMPVEAPAILSASKSTTQGLQAAKAEVERQVAALVNRTFDGFDAAGELHAEMQGVLEGLRGLVLRQARLDPGMLDDQAHPAWQLLQRLLYQSACHPHAQDARLAAYVSYASGLLDGSSALGDPGNAPLTRCIEMLDQFALRQFEAQVRACAKDQARLTDDERLQATAGAAADVMREIYLPLSTPGVAQARPPAADAPAITGSAWPTVGAGREAATSDGWVRQQLPGRWFRVLARGRWMQVQLLWRSPAGEHWIVSHDGASTSHEVIARKTLLKLREDDHLQGLGERQDLAAMALSPAQAPS